MTPRAALQFMGYSVRTATWRFTAWLDWDGAALKADWASVNSTELYDHAGDPGVGIAAFDDFENVNVADAYPQVAAELFGQLKAHFGG